MRKLLSNYQDLDHKVLSWQPLTWKQAESWTRRLPEKTNLVVPRTHLPDETPYRKSALGRRRGALRQYRCHQAKGNLHIKEFEDHWVMHVDAYNPHTNMVQHLAVDRGFKTFLHLVDVLMHHEEGSVQPVPVEA